MIALSLTAALERRGKDLPQAVDMVGCLETFARHYDDALIPDAWGNWNA